MAEVTLDQITVTLVSKPSGPGGTGQGHQTPGLSLAQARARASFSFDQPGYIPADFDFDDAAIVDSPSELVVLSFSAPTGNFLLVVAPVSQAWRRWRRYLVVAGSLDESAVGGAPTALAQQHANSGASGIVGFVWDEVYQVWPSPAGAVSRGTGVLAG